VSSLSISTAVTRARKRGEFCENTATRAYLEHLFTGNKRSMGDYSVGDTAVD